MNKNHHPIGIDIIEIDRFEAMHMRNSENAMKEIFTQSEWEYCHQKKYPLQSLAARFAAKEACLKLFPKDAVLETILFTDIEIGIDNYGAPFICESEKLKMLMLENQMQHIHVSLTHTESYACAVVMAE